MFKSAMGFVLETNIIYGSTYHIYIARVSKENDENTRLMSIVQQFKNKARTKTKVELR